MTDFVPLSLSQASDLSLLMLMALSFINMILLLQNTSDINQIEYGLTTGNWENKYD